MHSRPRSFVVQLDRPPLAAPGLSGRVESLDSGELVSFRSARGLLRFLRHAAAAHADDQCPEPAAPATERGGPK